MLIAGSSMQPAEQSEYLGVDAKPGRLKLQLVYTFDRRREASAVPRIFSRNVQLAELNLFIFLPKSRDSAFIPRRYVAKEITGN